MSDELVEMFRGIPREAKSSKVFPWCSCPKAFNAAVKAVKLKNVSIYTLKHTAASRMIRAGVDIVTVSEILGHSDIKMTMRYCHSEGASKRDAIEKVSRVYFKSAPAVDAPAAAAQPDHQTEGMVN